MRSSGFDADVENWTNSSNRDSGQAARYRRRRCSVVVVHPMQHCNDLDGRQKGRLLRLCSCEAVERGGSAFSLGINEAEAEATRCGAMHCARDPSKGQAPSSIGRSAALSHHTPSVLPQILATSSALLCCALRRDRTGAVNILFNAT